MIGRPVRLAVLLGAAVGIPYVWFNPKVADTARVQWRELTRRLNVSADGDWDFSVPGQTLAAAGPTPTSAGDWTADVQTFEQLFRFDISPAWVSQHWSRVSTVRSEHDLEGMRVAVVSGTGLADVAGSLTYYFDRLQHVRRITFHGTTGDSGPLALMVSQRFNLQYEPALGAGSYVGRWNGKALSVLHVSHAPVIRAQTPHERLHVTLELNSPQVGARLSEHAAALLEQTGLTRRI